MYVYMLTDTLSEDVPKLYGSQKRALAELQRRCKETLDDAIYLTDKDKETLKKDFKENKTWFTVIDAPPENRNTIFAKPYEIMFIHSCSVTKEYVK